MRRLWIAVVVIAVVSGAALFAVRGLGVSARPQPSWVETRAALLLRQWMTPERYKNLKNPVSAAPAAITSAREHFADHCASCHGNNGSGETAIGKALYPKAPDMRAAHTQALSDGELFYFIEQGVRLTGMPGWTTGTPEGETASWQLVHFIRHLPALTPEEEAGMARFNPRSPAEIEEERKAEDFLSGGAPPAPDAPDPHAGHKR